MEVQDNNLISPRNLKASRRHYFYGLETASDEQVFAAWESAYGAWLGDPHAINRTYENVVKPQFAETGQTLSLIIPAYREAHRIHRSIELAKRFHAKFPLPLEVLYIVERSPDDTLQRAKEAAAGAPHIRVIDNGLRRGKGHAVRSGMARATGDIMMFADTDLSVPLHQVILFLEHLLRRQDVQVLIGQRLRLSARGPVRRTLSAAFRGVISCLGRLPATWDTQCGFKAFRRDAGHRLFEMQQTDGFAFDVELLLLARSQGYRVDSSPVLWLNDERSTVRPACDFLPFARELQRLRQRFADPASAQFHNRVRY